MNAEKDLLKIVNDTGWPLQIAIEKQVNSTTSSHGWTVRYVEHSWINKNEGQSGFIDLVLQNHYKNIFLVIECKRVKDSNWIFLRSEGDDLERRHSKVWISQFVNIEEKWKRFGWKDIAIDPPSAEALFCVVLGQSSSDRRTMLERIGGELVSSTEALALEEKEFTYKIHPSIRLYFNVVVTTANLKIAKFSPADISLSDGTIESAKFKDVPFLRFRKQMSMRENHLSFSDFADKQDAAYSKENTLFVVKADSFIDFLSNFDVSDTFNVLEHN